MCRVHRYDDPVARCPTCHRRLLAGRGCAQHGGTGAPADTGELSLAPAWSRPLGARLGSGGFASVWEIAGSPNVLKVAHAGHELARARMRREAESLIAVGAPAVPRLHDCGVLPDGRAWIEMERIAGANLAELTAAGPMPIRVAIELAASILDALVRVHAAGFVHRDIKPDNLVRRSDTAGAAGATGAARAHSSQSTQITQITQISKILQPSQIVILDLGLARRIPVDPDDPTRAGVQVGSLEYIPPEQLLDASSVDARADLYAFGCVLYELCSGRPPFVGDPSILERAHAALRPPPLGALAPVSAALEALCHECLAKQPARRPASAAEVARRLRALPVEPAPGRELSTVSTLSEGKQPVVLLWAELPRVDRTLLDMLSSRKLALVSRRGRRVLGGLVGAEHPNPISSALAAARDLAAAGARVALHLDALIVRPSPGGTSLAGAAVEAPEGWLPQETWTGVVLTRAIAAASRAPVRASELGPAFVRIGEGREATELHGRDAVLDELRVDAAGALAGAGPALTVLLGEPGVGKSALAAALVSQLVAEGARVHLATVPPPGSGWPAHAALADLIGTLEGPKGRAVRAVGDAVRAAARAAPTAIVLDDLHLADHELLDALEYATLGGEPLALWVLGLAAPSLDHRRPGFGDRAERRARITLPPLDETAAIALAQELLRPAEYVPVGALRQIAGIARGNPMHLVTLAREIHERGAIGERPNGERFLDTTALDTLPPLALGPWLAVRELDGMREEVVALARLCAVLGGDLSREELAAVLEAVERAGGPATMIDVDIGLAELTSTGILVRAGERWTFRQALLEQGVYETTNEDERRALHTVALAYWRGRPQDPAVAARVARHAEAAGDRAAAAEAYAALGAHAHELHRSLDADQAWQGAVRNLDPGTVPYARALLGRARARYRLQRQHEARADLEEVIGIARAGGEPELEIEALLELATALDLSERYDESIAIAEEARQRLAALAARPRALEIDVELAGARGNFRRDELAAAVPRLRAVIAGARALGRWETVTIAGLLLAPSLARLQQLEAAEAVFAEMIELCETHDDRFHLAAALANRAWLWSARGEIRRSEQDARAVIQLTREGGQAHIERAATYNLAEDLLWQGQLDEALQLARRSLRLQQGHGEGTTSPDLMLIARILAAKGERVELAGVLAQLEQLDLASLGAEELIVHRALVATAQREGGATWSALLADSAGLPISSRLEIALLAARGGQLTGPARDAAIALARDNPLFVRRVHEM
jgi:eukaryotic-like serine/threonine-protein kinase